MADTVIQMNKSIRKEFIDKCLLTRPCHASHWGQDDRKGYEQAWQEAEEHADKGDSSIVLNPSQAVSNLHATFWNSGAFTVDITSVKVQ